MSASEELKARLKGIAKLPDREAYCWLKAQVDAAVRVTTPHVPPPHEIANCTRAEFVAFMNSERLGHGVPRADMVKQLNEQQRQLQALLRPEGLGRALTGAGTEKQGPRLVKMLEEEYAKKK